MNLQLVVDAAVCRKGFGQSRSVQDVCVRVDGAGAGLPVLFRDERLKRDAAELRLEGGGGGEDVVDYTCR